MKKEYRKHIVSDNNHQVWLHRTHKSNVEKILDEGLHYGTGDLHSTASLQPSEPEHAEKIYQTSHKHNDAVVVIKIPRHIAEEHHFAPDGTRGQLSEAYDYDKRVSYYHPTKHSLVIQRKHIHGWIDKETGEYHENLRRDISQNLTDKHFPSSIYDRTNNSTNAEYAPQKRAKKSNRLSKKPVIVP